MVGVQIPVMAFDLPRKEVEKLRTKYVGVKLSPKQALMAAEDIQTTYFEGDSALVGNLTTIERVQSTATRRPMSASVDLVVKEAGLEEIGTEFDSWSYAGGYAADIDKYEFPVELGIIDIDEFELFEFPDSILENSYTQKIQGYSLQVSEPEPNMASKFNRVPGNSEPQKGSDIVDMNSHIHWMVTENRSIEYLADIIQDTVQPPYEERLDNLRKGIDNFKNEEIPELEVGLKRLEELLSGEE